MAKIKESDLFEPLRRYYNAKGYIINNEVEMDFGSKRADIILTKPNITDKEQRPIGIELKTTLNFKVLDQAMYWSKYCNKNYICIPRQKRSKLPVVYAILGSLGVGLIEVDLDTYNYYYKDITDENAVIDDLDGNINLYKLGISFEFNAQEREITEAKLNRLMTNIVEEHQTWAVAGSTAKTTHVTTYKLVMKDVYTYLRKELNNDNGGWVTVSDIVTDITNNSRDVVKNHYKNTRASISSALKMFEQSDIENKHEGRTLLFKIKEDSTKYLDI